MVTFVGTLIFVFSLGYMRDEAEETIADHEVDRQTPSMHHFQAAAGDTGGFFYLSLFSFSMLNLVIADNLFQVFVSWSSSGSARSS